MASDIVYPQDSPASRVVSFELDDGQIVWVEVADLPVERPQGGPEPTGAFQNTKRDLSELQTTIRAFSRVVLKSFQEVADDERTPEKVSLQFGVKLIGEAGLPAIAKGVAEATLGVTIEWSLRAKEDRP